MKGEIPTQVCLNPACHLQVKTLTNNLRIHNFVECQTDHTSLETQLRFSLFNQNLFSFLCMLESINMAETVAEKRISQAERKESAYRRSNKPLMEKKRRARINSCLTQLKTLVLQAMRKDTNQYSKLEKADILEMTVKHLRQLQRSQISSAMSHDPTVATKYRAGFNECANEVVRYLGSVQGVNGEVRSRLMNHLGNVVTTVNQVPAPADTQTITKPLNVQIPQHLNQTSVPSIPSGCLLMTTGLSTSPMVIQHQQGQHQQQQQQYQQQQQQQHSASSHGSSPNVSPVQQQQLQQQQQQHHQSHHHQQQQNQEHHLPSQQNGPELRGSFHIIPNGSAPGAVALYLGQTPAAVSPQEQSNKNAVFLYSRHTPPRTKASLKSFDSSAFSQVSNDTSVQLDNHSPSDCMQQFPENHSDFHINGIPVGCGRTPSPLKIESVWRPW